MYKEYRDTTLNGAMSQMYSEMSGRHRAPPESIQIVKTMVLNKGDLIRKAAITYANSGVKFPKTNYGKRAPLRKLKTTFKAERPLLI